MGEPWKHQKPKVLWIFQGIEKENICLIWINSPSAYHLFIWSVASSGNNIIIEEKWIATAGNRRETEENSARIYIRSRNLKIHKNFSHPKLSHIKYSSGLLKQERSKNGGSCKSFNYLIVVGALKLIFINTECLRLDFQNSLQIALISYYFDGYG